MQPDSDRQIPTKPPVSIRGKRRFQMSSRAVLSSFTISARSTSPPVKSIVPTPTPKNTANTDRNTSKINTVARLKLTDGFDVFLATAAFI